MILNKLLNILLLLSCLLCAHVLATNNITNNNTSTYNISTALNTSTTLNTTPHNITHNNTSLLQNHSFFNTTTNDTNHNQLNTTTNLTNHNQLNTTTNHTNHNQLNTTTNHTNHNQLNTTTNPSNQNQLNNTTFNNISIYSQQNHTLSRNVSFHHQSPHNTSSDTTHPSSHHHHTPHTNNNNNLTYNHLGDHNTSQPFNQSYANDTSNNRTNDDVISLNNHTTSHDTTGNQSASNISIAQRLRNLQTRELSNHIRVVWPDEQQHQLLSNSRHYKKVLKFEKLPPVRNNHAVVQASHAYEVRLQGGRNAEEGRVEIKIGEEWGTICPDKWGILEAMVVCKQLGLHYASHAPKSGAFGGRRSRRMAAGVECYGDEEGLHLCHHTSLGAETVCKKNYKLVAGVICVDKLPDLVPNATMIQDSIYLQDITMGRLTCAMEENCAAPEAFILKAKHIGWHALSRRLLRFSAMTWNFGTAEFRPFIRRELWEWHLCHRHYHSMSNFAEYDIIDEFGNRVAHGHKASFCLEDNFCTDGIKKKYVCEGYGDQGISIGCADIYLHEIDCQWIDITEVPVGNYTFKMNVNPEFLVAELDYSNNVVLCNLEYSGSKATASNCKLTRG